MSAFTCLVIVPKRTEPGAELDAANTLLLPFLARVTAPAPDPDGDATFHPDGKWDWYVLNDSERGAYLDQISTSGAAVFPLRELIPTWSVAAIVTPKGQWLARTTARNPFLATPEEEARWPAHMTEIASAFPDHVGVQVLCHI